MLHVIYDILYAIYDVPYTIYYTRVSGWDREDVAPRLGVPLAHHLERRLP